MFGYTTSTNYELLSPELICLPRLKSRTKAATKVELSLGVTSEHFIPWNHFSKGVNIIRGERS